MVSQNLKMLFCAAGAGRSQMGVRSERLPSGTQPRNMDFQTREAGEGKQPVVHCTPAHADAT